jgi:lipopolysaccharide biosynthesis glycosyltransferase
MRPTLYTAYHKTAPLFSSPSIVPIHVGRVGAEGPLADMIGDDTGDHISDQNGAYCELTALYWAWKNDTDATHIGLMHYRRVLDVAGDYEAPQTEIFVSRFDIPTWTARTEDWLARNTADIMVPKVHLMGLNVRQNYARLSQVQDLDLARDIIAADHPDWLADYDRVIGDNALRLGNMMLMRRDLLDRYCTWAFDILDKIAAVDVDRSLYNSYQRRYLGFIAERLLTIFIARLQREEPDLKIREVSIINTSRALVSPYIAHNRLNGPDHINVAFAADRAYLPHTAAMVRSMLDHASPDRQINLFFLFTGVNDRDRNLLAEVVASRPDTHLHCIDAGNPFETAYRSETRAPSNATYNRFLLFDLLPGLDRLLYVDVDMIFCGDVAEIFDTEMGGRQIAAVPDFIMTRTLTGPTPTVDPEVPDLGTYQRETLGLEDCHIRDYFNAGLILFNFSAMDVVEIGRTLMAKADEGRYLFRDQDILNVHFKDSYLPLPARMNVFNTDAAGYGRVPAAGYRLAMKAKSDPLIIHYAAGDYKPWTGRPVPFADRYWEALIRTPFYAEVLSNLALRARQPRISRTRRLGRAMLTRAPWLRPPLYAVLRGMRRARRVIAAS